jgi:8-oxo-dGTP pyrophosphatase MutT (NUDIX family)
MNDNQLDKNNPEYDRIRHFKGTWKDYQEFWKKKGARMSPWEEWLQEYPEKKKMKEKDPIHLYKTFDDESIEESLNVGDQVIDKTRQILGVGDIDEFHPDGTVTVKFYLGIRPDIYRLPLDRLLPVMATQDSYQFNEAKSVAQSAGLAIVYNNKILIGHMTGKGWWGTYSIPKGHLDGNETILQAALRETYEEVGIRVPKDLIPSNYLTCPYIKKGNHYKDVHYYIVQIDSLDQIGLKDEIVPKSQLQTEEIDWAGFVPFKQAQKRIAPVMLPIIQNLKIYNKMSSFKTFEAFVESLDEDNLVAMAGSQEDRVPRPKPFVAKSQKKRKGSNEDEDDETQEVGNMNTSNLGTK